MAREIISAERLREVLAYDPATGTFTWRISLSNRIAAGKIAGARMRNMKKRNGYYAAAVICTCALITVGLGYINIWLGALALPILYGLSTELLR